MNVEKETIIRSAIAKTESVSWNVINEDIRIPTEATKATAADL